ncbi:hypothetical protein ASZ78_010990 [Callipepla squamata]|uniref:Olfactory receptor n=1 Tax=Callipepla squamata TaxID=9009 RepID=A0A226NEV1_CALSU|nr:hypothetical protein ASZ78_010990 [Callipepla squamata]
MHFFLVNLAFLDICYCSVTLPKMLADLFSNPQTIAYNACMVQLLFLHFLGAAEMFLLLAMAYDRYVAICKPLRYTVLVNRTVCHVLVGASWGGGFLHGIILFALTIKLPFCGLNILDNFFCDVRQLAKLACANNYTVELLMFLNNGIVIVTSFVLLLISYTVLLLKLQTHSTKAKKKITSTCVSHIVVVFDTFGPAIYIYVLPFQAVSVEKVVALFHTVIFPLTNPIIYTLCNKEIKSSMWKSSFEGMSMVTISAVPHPLFLKVMHCGLIINGNLPNWEKVDANRIPAPKPMVISLLEEGEEPWIPDVGSHEAMAGDVSPGEVVKARRKLKP